MADQIALQLPRGDAQMHDPGVTAAEVAAGIGRNLAKAALAARISRPGTDDEWLDLDRPITEGGALSIITPTPLKVVRYSGTRLHT